VGEGGESQDNATGVENAIFSAGNRQPAFFLGGNRMTMVAFEKEVSLKAYASLAFNDCSRVLKFYT